MLYYAPYSPPKAFSDWIRTLPPEQREAGVTRPREREREREREDEKYPSVCIFYYDFDFDFFSFYFYLVRL